MDIATVADLARLLYGDDWQRALARGLGPLHPDGARESLDDRLVRRWASGERPVPAWVGMALVDLMERRAFTYVKRAAEIRERARELRAELRSEPEPEASPQPDMRP